MQIENHEGNLGSSDLTPESLSESAHTPGPWTYGWNDAYFVWGVARVLGGNGDSREADRAIQLANASLIASAPTMYEELKAQRAINAELLEALKDVVSWVPGRQGWHTNAPVEAVERARAAIAKAQA